MTKQAYDLIVTGGSVLAESCMKEIRAQYEKSMTFLNVDTGNVQRSIKFCEEHGIVHKQVNKQELMDQLAAVSRPTLVLSIMNPYIFNQAVVENTALKIVNLHHAILPGHRGRNVTGWAIYAMEKEAGISWCLVDAGVDTGAVLRIERIPLTEEYTSLKLLKVQNELAVKALHELLPDLLEGKEKTIKTGTGHDVLHLSKEIPNGGIFDLTWNAAKQSAFLRAMDYGILQVFGKARVYCEDKWHVIRRYKIGKAKGYQTKMEVTENVLTIQKDGYYIELKLEN